MTSEALIVVVGGTRCAVPMERVIEVRVYVGTTRIPGAPAWLRGIVERDGAPVEVFDAAARLGITGSTDAPRRCIVFVATSPAAALLVDEVDGLVSRQRTSGSCAIEPELVAEMIDENGAAVPLLDLDAFFGTAKEHA